MSSLRLILVVMLMAFVNHAVIARQDPTVTALPEPLTLDYALSLAGEMTPYMQQRQADILSAEAGLMDAEALSGINAQLEAQARWIEPAQIAADQSSEDHRLGLIVNKTLYDFGRSRATETEARHQIFARQQQFTDAQRQRRVLIMQAFFAVVLADLQFFRYNEEMAVVFIALDKVKDRRELGQASDLDVLESEAEYQRIRHLRYKSENEQRRTRALLAQILNRPGKLPSNVAVPVPKNLQRKLDEVAVYQQAALENNAMLQALRSQHAAAEQSIAKAHSSNNPRINARLEAYSYERELSSNDKWRAGLILELPLWTGGSSDAALAKAQADVYRTQARLREYEMTLSQAVLDAWLELDALRLRLEEMQTVSEYRELYLDRSRALYEMEVKADLGDAMVKVSEAERNLKKIQFDIMLGWERLEALVGKDLNLISPNKTSEKNN